MSDGPGRFITLEGGEGAGKSTQIARLTDWLKSRDREVLATREPGGSPGAEAIRKLLVEGAAERWDGTTEALLHFAARRDHLRSTVWPALKRGVWVVSDRFADSTRAYQGYGHGLDLAMLDRLYEISIGTFRPDLQQSGPGDPRDAAAARLDGVNVDQWHAQRDAIGDVFLRTQRRLAGRNQ